MNDIVPDQRIAMHNPPIGPADLPDEPQPPYTDEELDVLHQSGQHEGWALVNALRAAQAAAQNPQVIHVTTPAPPPAVVHVNGHTHAHNHDGENLDVLIAFALALVTFFLSWWIVGANTDMSTWDDVRWAGVIGLAVGFTYLAASNGVRRLAGR